MVRMQCACSPVGLRKYPVLVLLIKHFRFTYEDPVLAVGELDTRRLCSLAPLSSCLGQPEVWVLEREAQFAH